MTEVIYAIVWEDIHALQETGGLFRLELKESCVEWDQAGVNRNEVLKAQRFEVEIMKGSIFNGRRVGRGQPYQAVINQIIYHS